MKSNSIKNKALLIFSGFFILILVSVYVIFSAVKHSYEDAEITNVLGRQRMLAQAMGKNIFVYENAKNRLKIVERQVHHLDSYITKMREIYTEKVVMPARKAGLEISMNPDQDSHPVIPFPATFTRMVNEGFKETEETEKIFVNILSDEPVNPKQILADSVDKEGFAYLKNNPNSYFTKIVEQQGKLIVNIYTPDKATTEGCVSCHTSIQNKPYKIGDILGIRKFSLVYAEDIAIGKSELNADLKEFIKTKHLFATTLTALQSGGTLFGGGREKGRQKSVKPVADQKFQEQLKLVQAQFEDFKSTVDTLNNLDVSTLQFRRTYQKTLELSTTLTEQSDDLTTLFVGIAEQNQQQIIEAITTSAVLTLFLLSGLYYYLNRSVLSPIIKVSNILSLLAKGELKQELIVHRSSDEIGALSISSNRLIVQLKMFIKNTANALAGKSQKNEILLDGAFYSALEDIKVQVREKEKAQNELKDAFGQLELKVQERTAELFHSNSTMIGEIEKRREMEDSLNETNEFLKNILDSPHNISIISTDLEKNIIYWNKGAESLLGYKAEEVVGKKPIEILYTGDEKANRTLSETVEKVINEKRSKSIEVEELTKYKDKIWVRMTISPRLNDKGEVLGVLGIGENISQQKFAEMELRENEERFRMILDTAYNAFVSLNEKGEVIEWNTQAERMFGRKKQEVVNQIFSGLIIPEDLREGNENGLWRYLEKGEQKLLNQRLELTAINHQGKSFPVEITITPLKHKGGFIFNAFIEDISERKLMTAQLNHAQKMESIGQLSAGIAHEINTPLQYIGDNIRFLQDSFKEMIDFVKKYRDRNEIGEMVSDPQGDMKPLVEPEDLEFLVNEIPAAIQQSLEGVGRVSKIVQAMKEFSHPGSEDKKLTDINKAIQVTVDVSRNVWKYAANIEMELDPRLPPVPCYADEMNQVFLNLIVNAAHTIEEKNGGSEGKKGTITISTRQDNGWVEICFKDTGKGIPMELENKIFDPFFTTKEVGKGTGQGLAITHSVITKKHKGEISFQSKVNEGTSFLVRLPI